MEFTITPWWATIACRAWHYCTMNFILHYLTNSGENSVGVHTGADMVHVSKCSTCWITWTHDVCQNDTGGVSGRYGSVECQCGSCGAVTHGVTRAQTHGHVKVDDDDAQCHTWNGFQVKVTWKCIHLSYLAWEVKDKHHRQEEQVQVDNNSLFHANPFYYALPHLNMPDTTQQYSYIILYWLTKFAILFILKCSYNIHNIQGNYTTTTSRTCSIFLAD